MTIPDDELVRRALREDPAAFNLLIQRHTPAVYRIVRRMCSDRSEAEAITQEAFLRAWENLPRSKSERPFRPWLIQIAVNAARDALRKSRPLDFADLPGDEALQIAAAEPGPEEQFESAEALGRLAEAVQALPAPYRMAVALRYAAEMSYEEMALALQLPLNTVRTHLHRAKNILRKALERDR